LLVVGFRSVISLALLAAASALPAQAAVITYTALGSGGDGPLSASATFTTGAGEIDITLTNTLALSSFVSVGQTVSDLIFTLSNAPGSQGVLSVAGQEESISATRLVTLVGGAPGRFLGIGGGQFSVVGNQITLEAIGGSSPTELIAPFEPGPSYPATNAGIDAHDPYTDGPASFVLHFSGITADTTVTSANFSFGTGPDTTIPGTPRTLVPEPLTLSLFGAGLIGTIALRRRKKA
jgi:hypothetical protein